MLVDGETGRVTIGEGAPRHEGHRWLAGIGTLLGGGVYMVVSLNRWEWNRALFFGLIVLIAEVGLATGLVLRRLSRLEYRLEPRRPRGVADILRETRPPSPTASRGCGVVPSR